MWITIDGNGDMTPTKDRVQAAFRKHMQGHSAYRVIEQGKTIKLVPVRIKPGTVQMEEIFLTAELEDDDV